MMEFDRSVMNDISGKSLGYDGVTARILHIQLIMGLN